MTIGFGFCSVLCGVGFGSVLGKTWVLVRFVLAEFGFFHISNHSVNETAAAALLHNAVTATETISS